MNATESIRLNLEQRRISALQRLKTIMAYALRDIAVSDGISFDPDTIWRVPPGDMVNEIFYEWCKFPYEYEQELGEMCLERLVEKIIH